MKTNANIKLLVLTHAVGSKSKSRLYLLVLTLLALMLFVVTSGLWSGAAFSEALFFSGLKGQAYGNFPLPTQKLFELLASMADNGSLWPLRIFSAFCAWLILLFTYFSARCLYGVNTAFLAALVLLTTPFFERFAVMGLPYMWMTGLISSMLIVMLTAKIGSFCSWPRWGLFWLLSLLVLLFCGLAALGAILPILLCHFLILKSKKQLFFNLRVILPIAAFAAMLAIMFCEAFLRGPAAWFSLKHVVFNFDMMRGFLRWDFWLACGSGLLNALGIWILALALVAFWVLKQLVCRKPVNQAYWKLLGLWLIAALLTALFAPYDNVGRFLSLLPPLAILVGYYLNRYARYCNSQPRSRSVLKTNAITLKFLLTLWGITVCGFGIWLFFNLEQAWQREFFLETRHLVFLIILGAFIIVLSVSSFWVVGRAYSYWGFVMAVLLSLSFISYGVITPSRDILYTPYYFNRNLKTLFPDVRNDGIMLGVLPQTDRNVAKARFFLYADYPVYFVTLSVDNFKDLAPALPPTLALTSDIMATLGEAPYEAGYRPVFWEEVAGTLLIVLERFTEPEPETERAYPLLNLAGPAETAVWSSGYCFSSGYLIPYNSKGQEPAFLMQVKAYQSQRLHIISAGINGGMRDPYVFRWLLTMGRTAPRGAYSGLSLHFKTPYIKQSWPYGVHFQQWALEKVLAEVQPAFTVFTGLDPQHRRTGMVLKKLLRPEKVRNAVINAPVNRIDFEWLNVAAFLKFYTEESSSLALELPIRK